MMDDSYANVLGVWDLDRPDAQLHARGVIGELTSQGRAKVIRKSKNGRYVFLLRTETMPLGEMQERRFQDNAELDRSFHLLLKDPGNTSGIQVLIWGLPDCVDIVQGHVDAFNERNVKPIRLHCEPQPPAF